MNTAGVIYMEGTVKESELIGKVHSAVCHQCQQRGYAAPADVLVDVAFWHQRMSGRLYQAIANYIDSKNGQCEVLAAPFAVFLNDDDINYVEPDISVICDLSKLDDKGCHGAPDWVIEIVSPSSKPRDYMTKLFQYCTAGVREYWIVDPDKQMTMVYGFEKNTVEQYCFGEDVPSGIYEGFVTKMVV